MGYLVEIILILLAVGQTTLALTCESCQLTTCAVVIDCAAGMVIDECNCCAVCAKDEGDTCGGVFDLNGKCGLNLYCHRSYLTSGGDILSDNRDIGVCKGKMFRSLDIVSLASLVKRTIKGGLKLHDF